MNAAHRVMAGWVDALNATRAPAAWCAVLTPYEGCRARWWPSGAPGETRPLPVRTVVMSVPSAEFLALQSALAGEYSLQRELGREPDTDAGLLRGTAHFISPEQAASAPLDGRSDIYALSVVGYLPVSGRLPFEHVTLPALLVRQASEPAASVLRAAQGPPSALGSAIDRSLERDPSLRFPDGDALAAPHWRQLLN